jgi:hypothetical protein
MVPIQNDFGLLPFPALYQFYRPARRRPVCVSSWAGPFPFLPFPDRKPRRATVASVSRSPAAAPVLIPFPELTPAAMVPAADHRQPRQPRRTGSKRKRNTNTLGPPRIVAVRPSLAPSFLPFLPWLPSLTSSPGNRSPAAGPTSGPLLYPFAILLHYYILLHNSVYYRGMSGPSPALRRQPGRSNTRSPNDPSMTGTVIERLFYTRAETPWDR